MFQKRSLRQIRFDSLIGCLAAVSLVACAGSGSHASDLLGVPGEVMQGYDAGLDITYDAERGELIFESKPVDLPAGTGHHDAARPPAQYGEVPVSGWLHGYDIEVVDAHGSPVPRATVHHVNIISPERRELFSPIMQRIGAAGQETDPVRLPSMLGYPVNEGDRIIVTVMLHNPSEIDYEGVRVRVRLPYSDTDRLLDPVDVFPFYLDVMPPASVHQYDVPPGGRHEMSWEGAPAVDGRILAIGGHLHTHGVALRLEDLTTGKILWQTEPVLDTEGRVEAMPQHRLWWKLGIPMRADHRYRFTAVYDNPFDTPIEGAMGAAGGIFAIRGGQVWPGVDVGDPDLTRDLELVRTGGAQGAMDGMNHSDDHGDAEASANAAQQHSHNE